MPSRSEKERRKAIAREASQRQREVAVDAMPISQSNLAELFDHLDAALASGCDHSLRFTRSFLQTKNLPEGIIIPWLAEYGGYCDCEILANVEQEWEH